MHLPKQEFGLLRPLLFRRPCAASNVQELGALVPIARACVARLCRQMKVSGAEARCWREIFGRWSPSFILLRSAPSSKYTAPIWWPSKSLFLLAVLLLLLPLFHWSSCRYQRLGKTKVVLDILETSTLNRMRGCIVGQCCEAAAIQRAASSQANAPVCIALSAPPDILRKAGNLLYFCSLVLARKRTVSRGSTYASLMRLTRLSALPFYR